MNKVGEKKTKTKHRQKGNIPHCSNTAHFMPFNLTYSFRPPTHYKRALKVVNEKERKYKWKSGRKK